MLILLAVLSAVGGFIEIPRSSNRPAAARGAARSCEHLEHTLVLVLHGDRRDGLAGAAFFYGGKPSAPTRMREPSAALHELLSGKYYVDEIYEALLAARSYWVSESVFLARRPRPDRRHAARPGGVAQRSAGVLGRVQTGSLQLYASSVLAGWSPACLWSWPMGEAAC